MNDDNITRIFCDAGDFCTRFERYCRSRLLPSDTGGAWFPRSRLALSEVMSIVIWFHLSGYRCFKGDYREYACERLSGYFPRLVSCNRFVELTGYNALPLGVYTRMFRRGKATGAGFTDSTPVKVCHNRRISQHKVFKGYEERGKSSTGWFYGFKLHLTINGRGEITSFFPDSGNVDDRDEGVTDRLCRELWGKLFGEGDIYRGNCSGGGTGGDKTGKAAEKEYEKQADGNGRESFDKETGGDRISKRFSEEHLPDRAQAAPEFYRFHGETIRGVVSLQFLTA